MAETPVNQENTNFHLVKPQYYLIKRKKYSQTHHQEVKLASETSVESFLFK